MHMAGNRLLMFARKPAPVQATWLAYCSTTGLDTIDYRLSDPFLDPLENGDSHYAEQTLHLQSYWCYQPIGTEPDVTPLPALKNGWITLGCLNHFAKVTEPVITAWRQILLALPQSRLIIHADEGAHRSLFLQQLEGIEPHRIQFVGKLRFEKYMAVYQEIDIALDPMPYSGGLTTIEALWMGVPLVTLAGQTAVGRGGLSLLSQLGLTDLVGRAPAEYVGIATRLAGDLPRLVELRETLRARMQSSPLMDAPRFARQMEEAYRLMWRNWCR